MPKNIPALKPKKLIKILEKAGCEFYREGKGDHSLYIREFREQKRIVSQCGLGVSPSGATGEPGGSWGLPKGRNVPVGRTLKGADRYGGKRNVPCLCFKNF